MRFLGKRLLYLTCLVGLCAGIARAQAMRGQSAPVPGYSGAANTATDKDVGETLSQYQSLSGVQNPSLGVEPTRSYWQPHFDVFGTADSNAQQLGQGRDWTTWISGSAGADIHRVSGISNMTLSYAGGGMYSNGNSSLGSGITQQLSFADKLTYRRLIVSIFDQASYLPQSSFGFGGLGVQLPTNSGLVFNPGQSTLTGWGQNLNNSTAVEVDYLLTPRSSLTVSGGYSLLHYFDSSLFNYGIVNARAGYNYQLSPRNSFAMIYTFGDFRYPNPNESFDQHTLQASFGRIVSGRLSFQVAAGPEAVVPQSSPTGVGIPGGFTLPTQTQILWSLSTSLQYQQRRYGMNLSYSHRVGGGSGVLVGAQTNTVTGSLTRQMSRTFSSGFTAGYSRNSGLPGAGAATNQLYDYWFGGVNLTNPIGETFALTLGYQVQYQTSNTAECVGPTCGTNVLVHMISVGLGWHERPLLF